MRIIVVIIHIVLIKFWYNILIIQFSKYFVSTNKYYNSINKKYHIFYTIFF